MPHVHGRTEFLPTAVHGAALMVTLTQPIPQPSETSELDLEWEETDCPQCGHSRWSPFLEGADNLPHSQRLRFAIVRCNRCGLRFTNPRPTYESMIRFYPEDYAPHRRAKWVRRRKRRWYPFSRLTGRPCPERRDLPWQGEGRLLDFGCGGGEFLCRMEEQGWKTTGMDSSGEVVQRLRDELGLNAIAGTLPHPAIALGGYDVITMWHSLEHVHQPLVTLRAAYQALVPGGKLYVAVPNIDSYPFAWFAQNWFGLELPRHLTHFCPKSLQTMLETTGFHVEQTRMITHAEWLRRSLQIAVRVREANLFQRLLRFKPVARFAAWMCYVMGQSDCIMAVASRPNL